MKWNKNDSVSGSSYKICGLYVIESVSESSLKVKISVSAFLVMANGMYRIWIEMSWNTDMWKIIKTPVKDMQVWKAYRKELKQVLED